MKTNKSRPKAADRSTEMKTKQPISMLCAAAMLLSGATAYAEDATLDFLLKDYNSIEGKIKISAKLNKPLDILSKVPIGNDFIDLQKLVESAMNSTGEYNYKTLLDIDSKKMQFEMTGESKMPLTLNRNLDVAVNAKQGMWLNLDYSSSEKPVYELTMQNPVFDKYIHMDMVNDYPLASPLDSMSVIGGADGPAAIYVTDSPEQTEAAYNPVDMINAMLNKEAYAALQKSTVDSMKSNSKAVKSGNKVTVTFTDKGIKQYLADAIKSSYKSMGVDYKSSIENYDEVKASLKKLSDVPMFDENNAMICEYTLDSNGYIKSVKTTTNIKTNVFDLIMATADSETTLELNHDKSVIDLTLYTETEYTKVNKGVNITFPELTDENTFDPFKQGDMTEIEDGAFDYSKCSCEYYDMYLGESKINGNKVEFKLINAFEGANVDFNNGKITITKSENAEEDYSDLNWYNSFFDKTIIINVGSDTVFIDDKAKTVSDIPYIIGDRTYITNRFIEEITGLKLNYLDGITENNNLTFSANYEKECDYCKEFFVEPKES